MNKPSRNKNAPSDFHREFNISYLAPDLPRSTLALAVRHYTASALIYGGLLLFFRINPWFRNLLQIPFHGYAAINLYYILYAIYLVVAPLFFFLARPQSLWASKSLLITGYLSRLLRWCVGSGGQRQPNGWQPSYAEKHALAFLLIKIFYGPLMLYSALLAYNPLCETVLFLLKYPAPLTALILCDKGYLLFIYGIFTVDSMVFFFGYHTESGLLRNKLRYAETNVFHILVCIVCYPPFNMVAASFFGPSNQDHALLFRGDVMHPMTWILRGFAALFLLAMFSTSLSLFTKASNLTNRGIVDWGPYAVIRHPGYLAKNLFWLMTLVPAFVPNTMDTRFTWLGHSFACAALVWGFLGWGTLYFLRALTEERFLMRDPDYQAYCRKVKYRFIPGVY